MVHLRTFTTQRQQSYMATNGNITFSAELALLLCGGLAAAGRGVEGGILGACSRSSGAQPG